MAEADQALAAVAAEVECELRDLALGAELLEDLNENDRALSTDPGYGERPLRDALLELADRLRVIAERHGSPGEGA